MDLFSGYHQIPAKDIVKANIHLHSIVEDAASLLTVLKPVLYITRAESQRATSLHLNVIQKLSTKQHALRLLKPIGYEKNDAGSYIYQSEEDSEETRNRQNAAKEFQKFYKELNQIKSQSLNGIEHFLKGSTSRHKLLNDDDEDDDEYDSDSVFTVRRKQSQPTSTSNLFRPSSTNSLNRSHRSPSPPTHKTPFSPSRNRADRRSPTRSSSHQSSPRTSITTCSNVPTTPKSSDIQQGNEKTAELIKSFKQTIEPKFGTPPPRSFIRRKLLLLLCQHITPDAMNFGDQHIEEEIDQRIGTVKANDTSRNAKDADEIYYECLIRTNFNQSAASDMLSHNRPNLKPPPEAPKSQEPTTTALGNAEQHLGQIWDLLNENTEENRAAQILLHEGDEWKNAVYIIPAISKLRETYKNQAASGVLVSKMYRLLYSELSTTVRRQSPVKIEILADALCNVDFDSLKYLNMGDIKDILCSCSDTAIPEDFEAKTTRSLSLECPTCGGSYPRSRMESMYLCDHMCCLDCAKGYYRLAVNQIQDSSTLKKLTCFEKQIEITEDIKLNFFLYLGSKFNQWFNDERLVLEKYNENLFLATRDSRTKKCGNPRCVGFFDNDNNQQPARAQCPHCQFRQCRMCCRKWNDEHHNTTCDVYAEWLRENDPDDPEVQLTKYLNTAGMMCPKEGCNAIYEYQAGGCEHFRCPQCRTEFCRICSALFYNPAHNTFCPRRGCTLRDTVHAHCYLNCFREIRDAEVEDIIQLLEAHRVKHQEELQQKPVANGPACPVDGCNRAPSAACENRFCDPCYKQFLCLLIWRNQIEPWTLYSDNNLRQKLTNAAIPIPNNVTRDNLIALARQHLANQLGKPKKIPRMRQ